MNGIRTFLKSGKGTFGSAFVGVCLVFLVGAFAGCGNSVGSVDYQSYCSQLEECSGGAITIENCPQTYRTIAENLSGSCQNAYIDLLNCQVDNNAVCGNATACMSESENLSSSCDTNPLR